MEGSRSGSSAMRARVVDRHVGARMRDRRVALGLTQQQVAEMIGVTYQQAHKYERGFNRISAGRLHVIAQVLRVDVSYFFEGLAEDGPFSLTQQQRSLLDLARSFVTIGDRRVQEALCHLARTLAAAPPAEGGERADDASRD